MRSQDPSSRSEVRVGGCDEARRIDLALAALNRAVRLLDQWEGSGVPGGAAVVELERSIAGVAGAGLEETQQLEGLRLAEPGRGGEDWLHRSIVAERVPRVRRELLRVVERLEQRRAGMPSALRLVGEVPRGPRPLR